MTIASGKLSVGKETKEWSEGNNYQVEPWQMKWLLSQSWNFYPFCLDSSWSLSMTYSEDWDGNAKLPPYEIEEGEPSITGDCYVKGPQWITSGVHTLIYSSLKWYTCKPTRWIQLCERARTRKITSPTQKPCTNKSLVLIYKFWSG